MGSGEIWKSLSRLQQDKRALTSHICVFAAILQLCMEGNGITDHIKVSRRRIMKLSHIKGIATYHKCISNLVKWGYIRYEPSYHPKEGSRVGLVNL